MRYRLKCLTISGFGEAVEKQENLDSAGGTVNAATTLESDLSGSSEIENACFLQLSNSTPVCISRESLTSAQGFTKALFVIVKN